ncbi:glyoxalase/bleomycin resistance/extradiol dioxygenase family protein [bacterium]|nr:glyoxalase/bleomycin resistance/extradiol dioxygenase family protein [bacterium]
MKTEFVGLAPVFPSQNTARDVAWYHEKAGFEVYFSDSMYAVITRDNIWLHLQWHANTESDPLLGGSVVRIFVKNIKPLFDELVQRGTVTPDAFKANTPWQTHEFGFRDLNDNIIFIVEDIVS